MGSNVLITKIITAVLSLFVTTQSNVYTLCYEDTMADIVYVYDSEYVVYKLADGEYVPLVSRPVDTVPALSYVPSTSEPELGYVLPNCYTSTFRSSCALITEFVNAGYTAETTYRDPRRLEMILNKGNSSIRAIITEDDVLRLYSDDSAVFDSISTYIKGEM